MLTQTGLHQEKVDCALEEISNHVADHFIEWGYQEYSTILALMIEAAGDIARATINYETGLGNANDIRTPSLLLAELSVYMMTNFYLTEK